MRLPSDAWRLGCFRDEDMPDYLIMRANEDRFKVFQKHHQARLNRHFYITVMPKTLDLLESCVAFLPRDRSFFLIMNGLERWEEDFIERAYPLVPQFKLTTYRGSIVFDRVLDLLMECNETDFGIIDQDCFVLDRGFFQSLQIRDNEFAVSPFSNVNKASNIVFPRTYFLLFNTAIIKSIRSEYELSFKSCWTIPARLEDKLAELHLGYHNFPHASLNYFDTFQLIWAMAMYRGFSFGVGPAPRRTGSGTPESNIAHIGAGASYLTAEFRDAMPAKMNRYESLSQLEKERLHAAAFSYYAHMRLLEDSDSIELKNRYGPFFLPLGDAASVLKTFAPVISRTRVEDMELVVRALQKMRAQDGEERRLI